MCNFMDFITRKRVEAVLGYEFSYERSFSDNFQNIFIFFLLIIEFAKKLYAEKKTLQRSFFNLIF